MSNNNSFVGSKIKESERLKISPLRKLQKEVVCLQNR